MSVLSSSFPSACMSVDHQKYLHLFAAYHSSWVLIPDEYLKEEKSSEPQHSGHIRLNWETFKIDV